LDSDKLYRYFLKACDWKAELTFERKKAICLEAMKQFLINGSKRNFSKKNFPPPSGQEPEKLNVEQKKAAKTKVLSKLIEANHPYYIRSLDMTTDEIPINSLDCIRINTKLKELDLKPDDSPTLWTPLHYCTFNVLEKTVVMDSKPNEVLTLRRGKNYERPRGD